MKNSILPFPIAKAMDVMNQILFLNILVRFTNGKLEKADLQKIASQLKVTHFDSGKMTENNLYALNQVSKCNIAPENLEVSGAKITMYTIHFRQEINAAVCRVKYQSEQWHCGFGDDSSMDAHHTGGITIDSTVTASQCRTLAKGGSISLKDEALEFKKAVKTTVVKHKDFDDDGAEVSDKYRNECGSYGWVNRKTFEGHAQAHKTLCLKYVLKMAKLWAKTDYYNYHNFWNSLDATHPHLTRTHTHGTLLTNEY